VLRHISGNGSLARAEPARRGLVLSGFCF
jgi:hypothetical protein